MKTRLVLLLGAALCLAAPTLRAQEYVATPVKVSEVKVRLNGKVYLSHAVQERQTIFGIAKAYGVTEEDLYEANPDLRENGLKANTTILIPLTDGQPAATPAQQTTEPAYIEHTVMWYEELEDIAAQYGVTPQEIIDANKMRGRKVKQRQVLKIPVKGNSAKPVQVAAAKPEPVKEVAAKPEKPKEEPKKEVVPPPEIPKLSDPEIKDPEFAATGEYFPVRVDKLRVEKVQGKEVLPPDVPVLTDPEIKDPELAAAGQFKPLEVDPLKVDPAEVKENAGETETEEDPAGGLFDWFAGKNTVEMALLLPFNSAGSYTESNMDFYSGVLLALRDLEAEGVKTNLNVYDFDAGVPSASVLTGNDFILGPISNQDLTTVLESVDGKVPVISPLDQRAMSLSDSYRGFIQAPSAAANQYDDLAAWAAEEAEKGDRIILVTERTSGSTAPATGVRNALEQAGIAYEGVSYTLSEGRSLPASLTARLTKGGVNRIIVASEKETFIGDAVRNLNLLRARGYDIVMYAPSKLRTFDTVDGSTYHQNALHMASPYFADYDSPDVRAFVRAYRALYRTEPSQFAFQGYDIARYFTGLCAKYGKRWTSALTRVDGTGLHTDFHFVPTGRGSYRNTAVRRIVYNRDYSTQLAR